MCPSGPLITTAMKYIRARHYGQKSIEIGRNFVVFSAAVVITVVVVVQNISIISS